MHPEQLEVVPLHSGHCRAEFSCGEPSLDHYLKQQVNQDRRKNLSRCYVLVQSNQPERVLGYFTLSAFSVDISAVDSEAAKGVPYPSIPSALIGRLAIDESVQGQKLGEILLAAAVEHISRFKNNLGIRLVVMDALNEGAARFYERYGFTQFSDEQLRLYLPLSAKLLDG